MPPRNLTWILLLALTALLVYVLRPAPVVVTTNPNPPAKHELELFHEARTIIQEQVPAGLDDSRLQAGAIRGMAEAVDPYSSYYPPELADQLAGEARGEYSGIGVELEPREGRLVILARVDGSPAAAAGLLPGDIIVAIDGQDADTLRPEEAAHRLNGPPGSSVEVSVLRSGQNQRLSRTLTRARIAQDSVRGWLRRPDGGWDWLVSRRPAIAYIRISSFRPKTAEELNRAVNAALRLGVTGLILDLRFNPGGQLNAAVECAALFLRQGVIVGQRQGTNQTVYTTARSEGTLPPVPLVVLVNRFTASSAEVFAGALAENRRAFLVGEPTWGKSTIQTWIPLSNGGLLKLTTARWYLPSGRSVQRAPGAKTWGLQPHWTVPLDETKNAEILTLRDNIDAAILKYAAASRPASRPEENFPKEPDYERINGLLIAADPQLMKAIEAMMHLATQPATQPGIVDLSLWPATSTAPAENQ